MCKYFEIWMYSYDTYSKAINPKCMSSTHSVVMRESTYNIAIAICNISVSAIGQTA